MANLNTGVTIGPYKIVKIFPHHKGGFSQVAIASTDGGSDGELVAIKVAKADQKNEDTFNRALSNEVETLRSLKHPGITRLYPIQIDERHYSYMARASQINGQPWYFVMEYLSGDSIEDLIASQGALNPTLAVEIAQQMCMALDYMHARGFAHLDIKTANVMLRQPLDGKTRPDAVLIDFGATQKDERRAEVEAGALVYLPPERVRVMIGDKPPESVTDKGSADIYSVGVTLYRMLTGELPFHGRRSRVTTAILNDTPTRPYQFSQDLRQHRELDELVMQMLDKRPERRPSARDVVTRLDQVMPPPRFDSTKSLPPPSSSQKTGRWKLIAAVLAALFIIQTGVLAANWQNLSFTQATPATVAQPTATIESLKSTPTPGELPTPESVTEPTPEPIITTEGGLNIEPTSQQEDNQQQEEKVNTPTLVPGATPES